MRLSPRFLTGGVLEAATLIRRCVPSPMGEGAIYSMINSMEFIRPIASWAG